MTSARPAQSQNNRPDTTCALGTQRYNELMSKTNCTCGNFGCNIRIARGLEPFCGDIKATSRDESGLYGSYSEAVTANPGKRVRLVSGGYSTGAPSRFAAVRG